MDKHVEAGIGIFFGVCLLVVAFCLGSLFGPLQHLSDVCIK